MKFFTRNKKLGPSILSFNLPVIDSCPGSSEACEAVCYARNGYFRYPRNQLLNDKKFDASKAPFFVQRAIDELRRTSLRRVRVHSSGDFYDRAYVGKWRRIATALPEFSFCAYTRSWRLHEMLDEFKVLAQLPNFELWFSADRFTGLPPQVENVRACWLLEVELPPQPKPRHLPVVLIFPNTAKDRVRFKQHGSAIVCPNYGGSPVGEKLTCSECGFCWTRRERKEDTM